MPLLNESKVASYYDNIKFKDLNFEFFDRSPKKNINYFEKFKSI